MWSIRFSLALVSGAVNVRAFLTANNLNVLKVVATSELLGRLWTNGRWRRPSWFQAVSKMR